MNDVFLRALLHPLDYIGGLRKYTLIFKGSHDLGNNVTAFDFDYPKNLSWKAGQHAIFSFPNKTVSGKKWRVFSIASSLSEGLLRIATSFPPEPSDFKQKLASLLPGEKVQIRGPLGEMYLKKSSQNVVAVAGGIGITPFRAILVEFMNGAHKNCKLELVYAGKENYYPFEYECREFAQMSNVTLHFLNTPDEVNNTLDTLVETYHNSAMYFISGSPGMVSALRQRLKKSNVRKIITDPFKGY